MHIFQKLPRLSAAKLYERVKLAQKQCASCLVGRSSSKLFFEGTGDRLCSYGCKAGYCIYSSKQQ